MGLQVLDGNESRNAYSAQSQDDKSFVNSTTTILAEIVIGYSVRQL